MSRSPRGSDEWLAAEAARHGGVRDGDQHAARVTLHESFHLYVDPDGVLRTDHELRLWTASAVRLHDKLERAS